MNMQPGRILKPNNGWQDHPANLPPGVVRGWLAKADGKAFCALYQMPLRGFMLAYKKIGDHRVTVERHLTFPLAQARAVDLLNSGTLVGLRHGQA